MAVGGKVKYSDDDMLDAVRQAAFFVSGALRGESYDEYRAAFGGPCRMGIISRFGTWRAACDAADVAANTTRSYSSRWSETDLIRWVADYLAADGSSGTYSGYAAWAKAMSGAPSGPRLRQTFPRWGEVKAAACRIVAARAARAACHGFVGGHP
ncbi:hypothetical protein [Nocardioides rubriscoriae]|uniref:hypothetical protein n=1 Tax=Nocardioides rubriscoriae TaxID=642762 RepID=UPI0011E01112|nr:hypothetical protein [Nocardioides rubriscoriae]